MRSLAVCVLMALVAAAPEKVIKMSDFDGKKTHEAKVKVLKEEMTVKPGETFTVKLESTPSTGFSWKVLGPHYGPLELVRTHAEKPKESRAGAPGAQVFEFRAKEKNQQVVLVFNYGRSFEGLGTSVYELRVKVSE
jgi:predicted secreted protein